MSMYKCAFARIYAGRGTGPDRRDKDGWARRGRAERATARPLVCEWKKSEEWKRRRRIHRKRADVRGGGGEVDEDSKLEGGRVWRLMRCNLACR